MKNKNVYLLCNMYLIGTGLFFITITTSQTRNLHQFLFQFKKPILVPFFFLV